MVSDGSPNLRQPQSAQCSCAMLPPQPSEKLSRFSNVPSTTFYEKSEGKVAIILKAEDSLKLKKKKPKKLDRKLAKQASNLHDFNRVCDKYVSLV